MSENKQFAICWTIIAAWFFSVPAALIWIGVELHRLNARPMFVETESLSMSHNTIYVEPLGVKNRKDGSR